LPVLIDLYRSTAHNRARRRPHRTPAQLMCRLLRVFLIRCPGRRLVFVGDTGSQASRTPQNSHYSQNGALIDRPADPALRAGRDSQNSHYSQNGVLIDLPADRPRRTCFAEFA
jgi:hypothetical protein